MFSLQRRPAVVIEVIAIAFAVGACSGDATGPAAVAGSYSLSLYDGAVMPVTVSEFSGVPFIGSFPYTCRLRFAGAGLVIETSGTAVMSDTLRTTCEDGSPDLTHVTSSTGVVSVSGDTITTSYPVSGLSDSYRTFARRSGTGLLIFARKLQRDWSTQKAFRRERGWW